MSTDMSTALLPVRREAAATTTSPRHRRAGSLTARRLLAVAIVVGALLIGVGTMASSLTGSPTGLPVGPPSSPEHTRADADHAQGTARLGTAPTASPVATASPGAPAPSPPPPGDPPPPTTPAPTPTTPPTTPPIVSYQAQDAELGSHARVRSMDGASGGQVVEFTSGSHMANLEHPNVTVGSSGQYRLTIVYVSDEERSVHVRVNSGPQATVSLPAADGLGSVTLSVELSAGANSVRIANDGGRGLAVDRISIAD